MSPEPQQPPLAPKAELRRRLTVLFTDLSDSTHLSGAMDAETYAEMLDDVRRAFTEAVTAHGGTINQFQGDGLQALFGYPLASEHASRHAVEAALEVHAGVLALRPAYAQAGGARLSVHSGIHAGLMLARQGDDLAGRIELFGPAVGLAKHLSDEASHDEILASEEALGPGRHFFETVEKAPLRLKGSEQPFRVHRILARSALRTRFEAHTERGLRPFIGRRAELKWLKAALDDASQGRPRFVALSAESGVGKTRLAEEFLQRAEAAGCTVLRGYCESGLGAQPLQPLVQMVRSLFDLPEGDAAAARQVQLGLEQLDPALQRHGADLLHALSLTPEGPAAAPGAVRRQRPEHTLQALVALFSALARRAPLVLCIDDWHWADGATRQVVHALREAAQAPLMVLATTWPAEAGEAPLGAAEILALGPLSDDEADASIAGLLPAADPFLASEIRRYAGGNPLFIEELCHSAAYAVAPAALGAAPGSAAWLQTLIEARVARLPPEQGRLLSAAAVIGNVVPAWLLAELSGCGPGHPEVLALATQDLVFPGERPGTLRFKHGITRDVVYAGVGLHQRRAMHQRIAELLQARTQPSAEAEICEALAEHHAGAADYAQAARFAEIAGDKAMAASSIDRAKAQYRAALQMLDRLPAGAERYQAWRSVLRRLGLASVFDPARAELALFHRGVELAREHQDAAGLAFAEYWLAYLNYALGESRTAVRHCERALQAATPLGDEGLTAQVRATLGQALAAASDYPTALVLLDDNARRVRERRPGKRLEPGVAYALACKASVLGDQGRFSEAHACFDEALASLPGAGHEVEGSVLCWRSGVNLWQGRWEAAREDAQAARRIAHQVRSLYLFATSQGLGAYAAWQLEAGAQPLRDMADAVGWLQGRDKNLFVSLQHGWLADALATAGQAQPARQHAARALNRLRQRDCIGAAMASRAMARLAAAEGHTAAAQRHLARAARVAAMRGSAHEAACNALCEAQVALQLGRPGDAAAALERACQGFEALQMAGHQGAAESLRHLLA